jgi:hypothetical protein
MTLQEVMKQVDRLTPEERKQLALYIIEAMPAERSRKERRSLREFRGVAAHLRDMDAQEYVNKLRSEED